MGAMACWRMGFVCLVLCAVGCHRSTPPAAPTTFQLIVQPLGGVSPKVVTDVAAALRGAFGIPIAVRRAIPLPKEAFTKPRARYRADLLLKSLGASAGTSEKIIGITTVDISTTKGAIKDWGVFGLGECPGSACVISTFRLRKQGEAKARERLARVAIHEVGHTLGLEHCPNPRCIMADAKGSISSVDAGADFCPICRARTDALIRISLSR